MTRLELEQSGFRVTPEQFDRLERLAAELLAANQHVNLTGARTPADLWGAHICDSLALAQRLGEVNGERLVDVGTGGGLPGLVLACVCPALEITLLDATRKKLAALETISRALGLSNVTTAWARVEVWGHTAGAGRFGLATARAVAGLATLVGYVGPLLAPGGRAWFFKSVQAVAAEVAASDAAARRAGLALTGVERYSLPPGFGERAFVCYVKPGP